MKRNKGFIIRTMPLVLLIVICFTSIVYAGDVSVDKGTVNFGDVHLGTSVFSNTDDYVQIKIPLSDAGSGVLTGEIGGVKISTTKEGEGWPLATRQYTLTAPDGTEITGANLVFSGTNGAESSKSFPNEIIDGYAFSYSEDIDGNGTPGLVWEFVGDPIANNPDSIYVIYTDANGDEQRLLVGKVGEDIDFEDNSYDTGNDIKDFGNNLLGLVGDAISAVASFIEEILVELFLPLGDGIVYFVSASVGEIVTTDSLVFNKVDKLNINYWNGGSGSAVKSVLSDVVNKWYGVFFKIAVFVYMMTLVVAGIQILLHSTAEKKAQYKEYIASWIIGVAILCLFPYAMKYIVLLGETAVTAVSGNVSVSTNSTPAILNDKETAMTLFGKKEFVTEMAGDSTSDSMFYIRAKAQESKKMILVLIYFILIGQMFVLLLMYYKRAFMIAFLITIFPLVAMTYAIDKMGDKKAQSFSIWFKEFIVNVVVQLFHAVVYVIVVNTAVSTFASTGGKNWLFMLICILFLFQGEKILRSIFSVESKANTIADLATTAATYTAMTSFLKGGSKESIASKQDSADMKAIGERNKARAGWGAGALSTVEAINSSGDRVSSPSPSRQGSDNAGQYRDNDPEGVDTRGFDSSAALDKVTEDSMKYRLKNGIASGLAKRGVSMAGNVAGATFGMAKGDAGGNMVSNMIQGSHLGSQVAKGALTPVTGAMNIAERRISSAKLASDIKKGLKDEELNVAMAAEMMPANVNPDEVADKHGEDMQRIYREALSAAARAGGKGGSAKAEAAYWNYIKNNTKK